MGVLAGSLTTQIYIGRFTPVEPLARVGGATLAILGELLSADAPQWGLELIKRTGRPSGTVYPALERLERAGWVCSSWEDDDARKGPRRRLYRLTPDGAVAGRRLVEGRAPAPARSLGLRPRPAG